jgi:hypothetical protein
MEAWELSVLLTKPLTTSECTLLGAPDPISSFQRAHDQSDNEQQED